MSRPIFGWSLPPGVHRLPNEESEPIQPKCGRCCSFLSWKPEKVEPWEDSFECNGKLTFHEEQFDDSFIRILGEDYRNKTYTVGISPCGDEKEHLPHKEINSFGEYHVRTCKRCGFVNKHLE